MNILLISPTKGEQIQRAKDVPRVGETVYLKDFEHEVRKVVWWPSAAVLEKYSSTWEGFHVSELEGDAAIEAMIFVLCH